MLKEQLSRREFIKRGLFVVGGAVLETGVIADLSRQERQITSEASARYPSIKKECGVAANRSGMSCQFVVKQDNKISTPLSREEQSQILQEYRDYRAQLFLKNGGIRRYATQVVAAIAGIALITNGLKKNQKQGEIKL